MKESIHYRSGACQAQHKEAVDKLNVDVGPERQERWKDEETPGSSATSICCQYVELYEREQEREQPRPWLD